MNLHHTHPVRQAADALAQDIWELCSLVQHLNEPDQPTPLAEVLRRHADRLQAAYEVLDVRLIGGMGAMAPMATQKAQMPIEQFAAPAFDCQQSGSCHDKHFSAN